MKVVYPSPLGLRTMGDERPSDALQPAAKKRLGDSRLDRDAIEDDDAPSIDPGTWTANAAVTRERRKVHVRRGVGGGGAGGASDAQPAAANPFAGVALSFPARIAAPAAPPVTTTGGEAAPASAAAGNGTTGDNQAGQPASGQAAKGVEKADAAAEPPAEDAAKEAGGSAMEGAVAESGPAAGDKKEADTLTAAPAQESKPATSSNGAATPGSIFGGSAGATAGFASLAAGSATGGTFNFGGFGGGSAAGSTTGGLFGTGTSGGMFGANATTSGGVFGSTGATGGFGNFSFPKLDVGSSLGKPLFGANPGAEGVAGGDAGDERPETFVPSEDPSVKPVVQLAVVQKVTGEEDERTIYAEAGKLYEYDSAASKWRERGSGELRLNVTADAASARMLMRQSGNLRLLLNARITNNMAVQRMQGAMGVTFGCVNTAAVDSSQPQQAAAGSSDPAAADKADDKDGVAKSGAGLVRTWAFRTKGDEKILALLAALEKAKSEHSAPTAQEDKKEEATGAAAV